MVSTEVIFLRITMRVSIGVISALIAVQLTVAAASNTIIVKWQCALKCQSNFLLFSLISLLLLIRKMQQRMKCCAIIVVGPSIVPALADSQLMIFRRNFVPYSFIRSSVYDRMDHWIQWPQTVSQRTERLNSVISFAFQSIAEDSSQLQRWAQKNSGIKILVAIGGWNEGSTAYSQMVASPSIRKKFVNNVISFLKLHHFNGLDIDWEYPAQRGGNPDDKVSPFKRFVLRGNELKVLYFRQTLWHCCRNYEKNLTNTIIC